MSYRLQILFMPCQDDVLAPEPRNNEKSLLCRSKIKYAGEQIFNLFAIGHKRTLAKNKFAPFCQLLLSQRLKRRKQLSSQKSFDSEYLD